MHKSERFSGYVLAAIGFLVMVICMGAAFADTDGFSALLTAIHAPAWVGWVISFLIGSGILGGMTVIALSIRDLINHFYRLINLFKSKNLIDSDTKGEINGILDDVMTIMSKIPLPFIKSKIPFIQKIKLEIDAIPGYAPPAPPPVSVAPVVSAIQNQVPAQDTGEVATK